MFAGELLQYLVQLIESCCDSLEVSARMTWNTTEGSPIGHKHLVENISTSQRHIHRVQEGTFWDWQYV
jgi:hypothetical protein